ncbi:unnamed protein product [Adineta steineri]|uniref:F-box domain-containing protein n=1 Tax=Adineta steineri TaxID=433720 RepID=A0A815CJJ8_9BILA|nr:unnamed protein product [Adineta steineri]CAF1297712.1 unnamed protein product [Adineta steineri]
MMNLELLPNEILLDIFQYLHGVDLLRAFYDLNYRFNFLLHNQYRPYCFNFDFLSKRTFDMICQQHLTFIADRTTTLTLSNGENTPEQIHLFFKYIPSFDKFIHLRLLSFDSIRSYQILTKIIDECHHLYNLTHLKFYSCRFHGNESDLQFIVNRIWTLSKLTHCTFDILIIGELPFFCMPQSISTSIQYLDISIENEVRSNEIIQLFEHTPSLKHLSMLTKCDVNGNYLSHKFPILTKLQVIIRESFDFSQIYVFFQNFPSLRHLDIDTAFILLDGYEWKEIIQNWLPNLRAFKLEMMAVLPEQSIQKEADELFATFQTSFWTVEHQWFVRCFTEETEIYLQTTSSRFNYNVHAYLNPDSFKSTCPHEDAQHYYSKITHIYNQICFDKMIPLHTRLPNIQHINIQVPINDRFWSIVSSLNQLKSMSVSSYVGSFQEKLQALFDLAPNLRRVSIYQDEPLPSYMSIFKCKSASVRELCLRFYELDRNHYFNQDDCVTLTHAPLSVQCEKLSISVTNRENIIYLVENLTNLYSLDVVCKDDECFQTLVDEKNDDELVQWLKDRLPSTNLIIRYHNMKCVIRIWI